MHTLARLPLNGHIRIIQVSRVKLGYAGAFACLDTGAKDFGGTLLEESISKAAGANFGRPMSPEELRALIWTIHRAPAERITTYKIRHAFEHADSSEFLWPEWATEHSECSTRLDPVGY